MLDVRKHRPHKPCKPIFDSNDLKREFAAKAVEGFILQPRK